MRRLSVQFRPQLAVPALKIKQRLTGSHQNVLDFSNKNSVIASVLGALQAAFKVRQSPMQDGSTVRRAIELCSSLLLSACRIAITTGVVLRNRTLLFRKHVNAKSL